MKIKIIINIEKKKKKKGSTCKMSELGLAQTAEAVKSEAAFGCSSHLFPLQCSVAVPTFSPNLF